MKQDELTYAEREIMMQGNLDFENLTDRSLKAILEALKQGNSIHAIKLYREVTGVSLTEARQAIKSIGYHAPIKMSKLSNNDYQGILTQLKKKRLISAVKIYQQATGVGLLEARKAIEVIKTANNYLNLQGILSHDLSELFSAIGARDKAKTQLIYDNKGAEAKEIAHDKINKLFSALENYSQKRDKIGGTIPVFIKGVFYGIVVLVLLILVGRL